MKSLRHVVSVMRPTKTKGTLGETQGESEIVMNQWPCSIETLQGREAELARQTFASATLKVEGYGDPRRPFMATDYLQFGSRKLCIGFINDKQQNGLQLSLLCGEKT